MSSNNTPYDGTPQRFWSVNDPYRYPIPEQPDPWNICFKVLVEEDEARCNAWRSEMQNMLTFAGLFSAVVTGFVIDSYKSLQPDPSETTNFLLAQLVSQSGQSSPPPFVVVSSSSRVNVFWFLSLILSLTTALVGITAMQWLNEYQRYSGNLTKKENFAQRQMRFEGLENWYVPQIIAGLPLLLQSALVLFFVGLVDFLTSLGVRALTISVMVVVAITLLFMITTTVLPAFHCIWLEFVGDSTSVSPPCPYKSAQSWAFLRIAFSDLWEIGSIIVYVLLIVPLSSLYQACVQCRTPRLPIYVMTNKRYVRQAVTWDDFERNWLHIRSSQSCNPGSSTGSPDECLLDAALGVACLVKQHVLDDNAAHAAYKCFKQLKISRVGRLFFSTFVDDGEYYYNSLASRAISADARPFVTEDEYGILFLQQFSQTCQAATHLKHIFMKHQLELYIRVCAFLFLRDDFDISSDLEHGGVTLVVPLSLTGKWGEWVYDYKPGDDKIYEFVGMAEKLQLLDIFAAFVHKVISDPPANDDDITKFYIYGTLDYFMYSIHCILIGAVMSLPPSCSSLPTAPDQGQGKAISEFSQQIHKLATHLETAQPSHSRLALSIALIHLSLFSRYSHMLKFALVAFKRQPGYAKSVKAMYDAFQLFRERFGDEALPPVEGPHHSIDSIGSEIMKALSEEEKQGSREQSDEKGNFGGTREQDVQHQASSSSLAPKSYDPASHDPSKMV